MTNDFYVIGLGFPWRGMPKWADVKPFGILEGTEVDFEGFKLGIRLTVRIWRIIASKINGSSRVGNEAGVNVEHMEAIEAMY